MSCQSLCSAYFHATEDFKFQEILSALTNSGVPAQNVQKSISVCKGSSCDLFYTRYTEFYVAGCQRKVLLYL